MRTFYLIAGATWCAFACSLLVVKAIRRRSIFGAHRREMSDDEFLSRVAVQSVAGTTIVAMRRCLADMCRIPYCKMHDDDDLGQLSSLVQSGLLERFDATDFIFRLESVLGRAIHLNTLQMEGMSSPKGCGSTRAYLTVGAWFRKVGPQIEGAIGRELRKTKKGMTVASINARRN